MKPVSNPYKLEQSSKTRQFRKYKLKKDIVIPAGTIMVNIDGNKREFVSGMYEITIGLTNDTSGYFTYGIDTGDPNIDIFFEGIEE